MDDLGFLRNNIKRITTRSLELIALFVVVHRSLMNGPHKLKTVAWIVDEVCHYTSAQCEWSRRNKIKK
jgi:hypothetical protein